MPSAKEYYQRKLESFSDKDKRVFDRAEIPDLKQIKHIHLVGICGTAMGSLAGLLRESGYRVSGSDEGCYPPMSTMIARLGIEFKEGYKESHLSGADLIIIGNTCRVDNPEAAFARDNRLPALSLPEAIKIFFIDGRRSIVVAGTHGKTTTTGLLAHVFSFASFSPSYLVGGVMQNYEESFHLGKGKHFIIEGDEYDTAYFDKSPKFLHYSPASAIITSLEFDHADIYHDMTDYIQAFSFFVESIPSDGSLFLCGDDIRLRELGSSAKSPVIYYGLEGVNDVTARDVRVSSEGQEFRLHIKGEDIGAFFVTLHGNHNLLNTLAVCGMAIAEGISPESLREGLKTFKGMKRRQEIVGEVKGVTVIDDFAHHPTAVRETIKAIKDKFAGRRLVVFFEPRSNTSRRKIFEEEYSKAFDGADEVYLSVPPFRHNDRREDFIDTSKMVEVISARGPKAFVFDDAESLLESALLNIKKGDIVLIMSNGSFGGIHQKLLKSL
ncbi:MAG: Mur ligase family protein [bacterium]